MTMNKSDEIKLLQEFTVRAREAGAEYLYEALVALGVPFESTIRSDFPGGMAVNDLVAKQRELLDDIPAKRKELAELTGQARNKEADADRAQARLEHTEAKFRRLKEEIQNLLSR